MGNCQAAEAATVVIQHPGGAAAGNHNKVERIYWSVRAHQVMAANPGHYVAHVISSTNVRTVNGGIQAVKQLKLLRPDDTLLLGHVYRLVTYQEVMKEYAAKKCVKLGKLLKESEGIFDNMHNNLSRTTEQKQASNRNDRSRETRGRRRQHGGGAQWKPALRSISENGI